MKSLVKLLPVFLFMALTLSCPAQMVPELQEVQETEPERFRIALNFSPDYCYRTLINNDGTGTSTDLILLYNKNDRAVFGYTAGANLEYIHSKRISMEGGLNYSKKGYGIKPTKFFFGDQIDPRYGYVYSNNLKAPVWLKTKYNFNYLDIPLRVIVTFGEQNIRFITSIGITTNILLSATQTSVLEFQNGDVNRVTVNQAEDFNNINISPALSAGILFNLEERYNIRFEPTFRYGLLKINDTPVSAKLWNFGLNFSWLYTL